MSNVLIDNLFEQTYRFISSELLPLYNWREFEEIFAYRQQKRTMSIDAWIDVLPILASRACGGVVEQSIPLAAAWCLYLFAGRIMDDIQDDEGKDQLWNQEGFQQALPTASFVLGIAHTALARLQIQSQADILDAFGRALALASQAQREQKHLSLAALSVDVYFNNLISRTAVAFGMAGWAGARLASATPIILEALYNYGLAVGIAIQIEDDCQDLVRSDILAGVYTLPIIYALSQTQHPYHSDLLTLLPATKEGSIMPVNNIAAILTEMKAFQWSHQMAGIYRIKAINAISSLPLESDVIQLRNFALGKCQYEC